MSRCIQHLRQVMRLHKIHVRMKTDLTLVSESCVVTEGNESLVLAL